MFRDRSDAGHRLAERLREFKGDPDLVVVGLPRGGVPVAYEVAAALGAPLDVIVVRKLGVPFQPELGMGAIGEGGVRIVNDEVVRLTHVTAAELAEVEARERTELERRAQRFRGGRERVSLSGKVVVVVDDGIATGSTARAACEVARAEGARKVIVAVPVAPVGWVERMAGVADETVALATPDPFVAIGWFYADFAQTTDEEVVACLSRARPELEGTTPTVPAGGPAVRDPEVVIPVGGVEVGGNLTIPEPARAMVVFAHGSGSSRHSPRNRFVASVLNNAAVATLLFDLLTPEEEVDRANVFDIELLARRLGDATRWVREQPELAGLSVGYFGASTGAAAALWAAAEASDGIAAVVSRGGRPDLARERLRSVQAPTLLIVGGHDEVVLDLNRQAQAQMRCETSLVVIPGATHLFEEPGTLEAAAEAARDWFLDHLAGARPAA